eukprot:gene7856-8706_t
MKTGSFEDLLGNHIIFNRIYDYLSVSNIWRLKRVSRQFSTLSKLYLQYCVSLDFSDVAKGYPLFTTDDFLAVTRESRSLRALNLSNCAKWLCDKALVTVLTRNPRLTKLDLSRCDNGKLSGFSLVVLAYYCPKIEIIVLDGDSWVSSPAIEEIGQKCRRIRTLNINHCDSVNDKSLSILLENNLGIKELSIRYCRRINVKSMSRLEQCTELRSLDISRCIVHAPDSVRPTFVTGCKQLMHLDLTHTHLSSGALKQIGCSISELRSISLAGLLAIDDDSFTAIVENNRNLLCVNASLCQSIGEKSIIALSRSCRDLRELDISRCANVTSYAVEVLGENCRNLRKLNFEVCEWLRDEAIAKIAAHNTQVTHINLAYCSNLGYEGVAKLFSNNQLLNSVNIAGCVEVNGLAIKQLRMRKIRYLNIDNCAGISDLEFRQLFQKTSLVLEHLDVQRCSWLSSRTLAEIGMSCSMLKALTLSGCTEVNSRSLLTVLVRNRGLKYVDVRDCGQIENAAVCFIKQAFPRVTISGFSCDGMQNIDTASPSCSSSEKCTEGGFSKLRLFSNYKAIMKRCFMLL